MNQFKVSPITKSLQTAYKTECIVRRILSEQTSNGVYFNTRRANRYLAYIEQKKLQLYSKIRPMLELEIVQPYNVPVNKPFLKNGSYSSPAQKWFGDDVDIIGGPFTRIEFKEPDLGSRKKLQSQLLRMGWKPRHFTEKGNPKLTVDSEPCESLSEIDSQVGADIAKWYILSHRESQIRGWLDHVRPNQRIPQEVFTIGTPTYRMRHKILVNVPKAASHVVFGRQMRSLFTVPRGKVMVGHDAAGLELRMLAHYINDPAYTKVITEGDPHEYHREMTQLPTRDGAKTFIYRFNYGGGNLSVGLSLNPNLEELKEKYSPKQAAQAYKYVQDLANDEDMINIGKGTFVPATKDMAYFYLFGAETKSNFLSYNPKLEALIERAQEAAKRGWVMGLDGRRIHMRRDFTGKVQTHKALNTLLQTAGAIVMKYSIVLLDQYIREEGLHSIKVIDMHDEAQFECLPEEAERHGELAVKSIREAGKLLGLNCPLDAEYKIGTNWAQTH